MQLEIQFSQDVNSHIFMLRENVLLGSRIFASKPPLEKLIYIRYYFTISGLPVKGLLRLLSENIFPKLDAPFGQRNITVY